jgi:hypothetical protein
MRRHLACVGIVCVLVAAPALTADRFVATTGNDAANDCLTSTSACQTIGAALGQAGSGDTIKVTAGVFHEHVLIDASTALTVEGGWSADFGSRDPSLNVTTLDAQRNGRTFDVAAGAGETISLTIDGVTITHGRVFDVGSVIRAVTLGNGVIDLAVRGCIVEANRSPPRVGVPIYIDAFPPGSGHLTLADSIIRKNASGGVQVNDAVVAVVTDTVFERNRRGPAFRMAAYGGGTLTMSGCTVNDNDGRNSPVHIVGVTTVAISDSSFTRNRSPLGGSGVQLGPGAAASMTADITNCVFRGHRAGGGDGAGLTAGGPFFSGGALDLRVVSSTFVGNRGSGLRLINLGGTIDAAITDTILWDNTAGGGSDLLLETQGAPLTASADHDVLGTVGGTGTLTDLGGNLTTDPLLVSATDVHLTAGSPAIDAGTCTGAPAIDFEGDPRPSGGGCDIGADEF